MKFFLLLPLSFLGLSCIASHIVGGIIHYECVGNNTYDITLYVYRDCNPGNSQFDNSPTIGIYENSTLVESLTMSFSDAIVTELPLETGDPCLSPPNNVCVQEAIYTGTVTLPATSVGYMLAYQRCCRNTTILNVPAGGDNLGSTFFAEIPPQEIAECNSNPLFNELPPVLLCLNEPFVFDHSATDIDGDSLAYVFCNPKDGGLPGVEMNPPTAPPYIDVPWNASFSVDYPITSDPAFELDPITGLLTGTPTQVGQYVVGICVEEWRNGVLVSTTNRDFQFNVVICGQGIISFIEEEDPCQGTSFSFENGSAGGTEWFWDFGVDELDSDTSNLFEPEYTYPDTGTYNVMLVANPGEECADTVFQTVFAYDPVVAEMTFTGGECAEDGRLYFFEAVGEFGPNTEFSWDFGTSATPNTSDEQNPDVIFTSDGTMNFVFTLTEAVCSDVITGDVIVPPFPSAIVEEQTTFCGGLEFDFVNFSTDASTYFWDFDHPNPDATSSEQNPSHTFPDFGEYNVTLVADPLTDCADTTSTVVTILPPDPIQFAYSATVPGPCDSLSVVQLDFTGFGADEITWDMGDGTILEGSPVEYVYENQGEYTIQITAFQELCDFEESESTEIFFNTEVLDYPLEMPNIFSPNNDGKNEFYTPYFALSRGVPVTLPGSRTIFDYLDVWDMEVYNRWGNLVFESNNSKAFWDGRIEGELVAEGTYFVIFTFQRTCLDSKPLTLSHDVTVVR